MAVTGNGFVSSPFEISSAEHDANMSQFMLVAPAGGKASGEAARGILMRSGLPTHILAQIWSLSDLDRDGQLDAREFSIAMKLTRNCVAGIPLPQHLPPTLLNVPLSGSLPRSIPLSTMSPPMAPPPTSMPGAYPLPGMAPPQSAAFPVYHTAPAGMLGAAPPRPAIPTSAAATPAVANFPGKQLGNWTLPQPHKLKYSQHFNQIDKQRTGFLSGAAARNAMGQSGLPTPALAHIWTLSDVNKDGRLSVEEFWIAMHLIDMHKAGYALPSELPPELSSLCHHALPGRESPVVEPGVAPAQKSPAPKTFEDKRKDNYDRGQAELDRRRQILQDEENRRKAEIAKREREEQEKRERERAEIERKREAERQLELERLRALEEERQEQERRREAERERQRQEAEKSRRKEAQERRKRELLAAKDQAAERLATQKQKQKTLAFQIQALDEKTADLNTEINQARDSIEAITKEIEGMRLIRDEKLRAIEQAQAESQQSAVAAEQLAHQLLQQQGTHREASQRSSQLDELRRQRDAANARISELERQITATTERNAQQRENVEKKRSELESSIRPALEAAKAEHAEALQQCEQLQRALRMRQAGATTAGGAAGTPVEKPATVATVTPAAAAPPIPAPPAASSQFYDAPPGETAVAAQAFSAPAYDTPPVLEREGSTTLNGHRDNSLMPPDSSSGNGPLPSATRSSASAAAATVKYRALFAFDARSEDELTFQPGDVILVFEGHAAEPGWMAGQINDKVGWFPAAFAEPLAPVNPSINSPMQTVQPNVTPSPSLEKILEEPSRGEAENTEAVFTSLAFAAATASGGSADSSDGTVLCSCVAQFPWKARNGGDLSFAKGDQIEVLERSEMKWRGRKTSDGSIGWFPKSYVKVLEEAQSSTSAAANYSSSQATPTSGSAPSVIPASASAQSIGDGSIGGHSQSGSIGDAAAPTENSAGTPLAPQSAAPHLPGNLPSGAAWFMAMYDFDAVEEADLPIKTGDRILVTERNDDWWKGTCNGREGIFPANYVQPATVASAASTPLTGATPQVGQQRARVIAPFQAAGENQLSLRVGDIVKVRSRSEAGWWEGELADPAGGPAKIGWFPGDYVQVEPSTPASATVVASPTAGVPAVVALFDYDASQADELSFKTGDRIIVEQRTDAEWWTGFRVLEPAKRGLFPANYVQPEQR